MVFGRRHQSKEEDLLLLKAFFGECAKGLIDQFGTTYLAAPDALRPALKAALANDPRPQIAKQITDLNKRYQILTGGKTPGREFEAFVALAKSALLEDAEFDDWSRTLSKRKAKAALTFRTDWHQQTGDIAKVKSDIENYNILAGEYQDADGLELAKDGLIGFLMPLTAPDWHQFMCAIEWECDQEPEILGAATWVLRQDTCDRATALVFLATAQCSAIDTEPYGYIDTALARDVMAEVTKRLDGDGYVDGGFEVPAEAAYDLENYQSRAVGRHAKFTWAKQGDRNAGFPTSKISMINNRPRLSFENWRDEREANS